MLSNCAPESDPTPMSFLPFCQWLADTPGSIALHESLYMYPLVESVARADAVPVRRHGDHVRSAAARRCAAQRAGHRVHAASAVDAAPASCIMVITGALLFYAIPVRSYQNVFFRLKSLSCAGRPERLHLPHRPFRSRRGLGPDADPAAGGAARRRDVARPVGAHHRGRTDDRLQLVRLRQAAAAADRSISPAGCRSTQPRWNCR